MPPLPCPLPLPSLQSLSSFLPACAQFPSAYATHFRALRLNVCAVLVFALQVHDAILVHLVCGVSFPPVRLDLIKNLRTPAYNAHHGCCDPDCLRRAFNKPCKGNRMSVIPTGQDSTWHFGYPSKAVRLEIVHGKNDRRQCREMYNVSFTLPEGPISKLLLAHLFEGQHLLTHHLPDNHGHMFVTGSGASFSNAVFTQYWAKLMRRAEAEYGLAYFPPSLARTIFVEDYTLVHGSSPDMLEGAAAIMGNTVAQWEKSYNPSKRRRLAREVVAHHHKFARQVDEIEREEEDGMGGVEEEVFEDEDEEMVELEFD